MYWKVARRFSRKPVWQWCRARVMASTSSTPTAACKWTRSRGMAERRSWRVRSGSPPSGCGRAASSAPDVGDGERGPRPGRQCLRILDHIDRHRVVAHPQLRSALLRVGPEPLHAQPLVLGAAGIVGLEVKLVIEYQPEYHLIHIEANAAEQ